MSLRLSPQALQRLEQGTGQRYTERLAALVPQLRPDLASRVPPHLAQDFARAMTEQARSFGLATEFEVAVFFAACVLLGRGWQDDPRQPLREVLLRTEVAPHLRATQLLYELEQLPPVPPVHPTPA